jgi:D-alanine transaminase
MITSWDGGGFIVAIGFINGKFVPIDQEVVPIDERGHQFGDGVYEVVKVYQSYPFMLDEHLQRLKKSAAAIKLKLNYTSNELKDIIVEGIKKSELSDAEVYLQVTRGIAPRNHLFPDIPTSTTMTIRPARSVSESYRENGAPVMLMDDERWENCYIKSLNLLPNILAKQEAYSSGCFEAILVRNGYVTEGSSTNVFAVKDGVVYTTPLSKKILHGITRQAVLGLAKKLDIPFKEEEMTPGFLLDADEVFITSTTAEVLPVSVIDGQEIGSGKPGVITVKLQESYRQLYNTSTEAKEIESK